jgi:hypothetical protein
VSSCAAHGREWADVICSACKHKAGKHASEFGDAGCMNVSTLPDEAGPCMCPLAREQVLYTALQFAIAEVCEHNAQQRARREGLR